MIRYIAAAALIVCAWVPLEAQYGPVQDSTLTGLRRVALNFNASTLKEGNLLREEFALEMRKAGIRVAQIGVPDSVDGTMNVLLGRRPGGSCEVRLDIEQLARLMRTGKTHRMVTWFYWDTSTGCGDGWFKEASKRAVDAFLTKWLDMNGR